MITYTMNPSIEANFRVHCRFPTTEAELSAILNKHFLAEEPTRTSAARTGTGGAAAPIGGEHLVSLERMRGVLGIEQTPEGRPFVRVLSGTPLIELQQYLLDEGGQYFLPPGSTETAASVGGLVVTNASWARSYHYGATSDWVYGLKGVLADGSRFQLRRGEVAVGDLSLAIEDSQGRRELSISEIVKPPTKHALGYCFSEGMDLLSLFSGSEGTLAIFSEVEFYLEPTPRTPLYLLQFFSAEEQALRFVEMLRDDVRIPAVSIEYWDAYALTLAATHPALSSGRLAGLVTEEQQAAVYLEAYPEGEEAEELCFLALEEISSSLTLSSDVSIAGTERKDAQEIAAFRHAVPERINSIIASRQREEPGIRKLASDMAVPPEHLHSIVKRYREELAGLEFAIFGHAGDNHFHVNILPRSLSEFRRGKEAFLRIAKDVVDFGGAANAEHAIGVLKERHPKSSLR